MHGGLGADEKIWQDRIISVLAPILAEGNARAPRGIGVDGNDFKVAQILIHCIARATVRSQFRQGHGTDGEPIAPRYFKPTPPFGCGLEPRWD